MLDWDDLRYFLALNRHGSLSAAAKALNVAQTTVGRRLQSLEASLGVRLLNRTPDGYLPTMAGREVREKAERVEAEALTLERRVSGRDTRLAGLVRITCAQVLGDRVLGAGLATLHLVHPDIMLELIPTPPELSLAQRQAEISVSLRPTDQHDLVIRRIGTLAFGLYASPAYLERRGDVNVADGCAGHHLVTQTEEAQNLAQTAWLTDLAPRARVALQAGDHESAVMATLHGGGLACLARFRADREPGLRLIPVEHAAPSSDIWLLVHKDNRDTPRIRVVLNHITDIVRRMSTHIDPDPGVRTE